MLKEKKEYSVPQMEAIDINMNQQLLAGSNGGGYHTNDPQNPGGAMSPEFQEMQDLLFGE